MGFKVGAGLQRVLGGAPRCVQVMTIPQEQGGSGRSGVRAVQGVQAISQWNQEQKIGDFVTPYPGAYILLIFLPEQQSIRVGSLGEIGFLPGWYAYVGSAMGGLRGRISRYLRRNKKVRWHIDYFLTIGILKGIVTVESKQKIECLVSRCLAEKLPAAADRFGASDCTCGTHLYFASTEKYIRIAVEWAIEKISKG